MSRSKDRRRSDAMSDAARDEGRDEVRDAVRRAHFDARLGVIAAFAAAALLASACANLSSSASDANADSVARAESAFAANASSWGVKAAFLDAMADDATLFVPARSMARPSWRRVPTRRSFSNGVRSACRSPHPASSAIRPDRSG